MRDEDRPWVENYPPLALWLKQREARCGWQLPRKKTGGMPHSSIECWLFRGGASAIIVIYADRLGFEIYTPGESNRLDLTFADAEKRLGLEAQAATG